MSDFVKPEEIIVDDFVLRSIPATMEYAQMVYDIFVADADTFRRWFNGGMYKSVDEVLTNYQNKAKNSFHTAPPFQFTIRTLAHKSLIYPSQK